MSQPLRHQRMLSVVRRSGIQTDYQTAMGRTPRHAQGWREMQNARAGFRLLRSFAMFAWAAFMGVGMMFWFIAELAR